MLDLIRTRFEKKSIVLLGFGREGQATYALLRKVFPEKEIAIADQSETVRVNPVIQQDRHLRFITGPGYLGEIAGFDAIFRSPGIPVWHILAPGNDVETAVLPGQVHSLVPRERFTSQTELFLERYAGQVIGITGTKGKSTTSSLIHHIFKTAGRDVVLAGNIGNPVFHFIDLIGPDTTVVFELSSHQLELLHTAPYIAVLLNLFQEHLDAYESFDAYQAAKVNITKYQSPGDCIIYNGDDPLVTERVSPYLSDRKGFPFSLHHQPARGCFISDDHIVFAKDGKNVPVWKIHQDRFLRGEHNLKNIMAAVAAAMLSDIATEAISDGIATFKGLEHRLEYVGEFAGIHFYNDSIATIPEACMEAIKAIPDVDTLVAGGFDRGIDYEGLAVFLCHSAIRNIILVGDAGMRIREHMNLCLPDGKSIYCINRFEDFGAIAFRETRPGKACLLSPAAASYDEFRNFEERGKRYRDIVTSEKRSGEK